MAEKKKGKSLLELLGAGMAHKAGKQLSGRSKQLEEEIRGAVSGTMRKKKK